MSNKVEENADPRVAELQAKIDAAKAAYDAALVGVNGAIEANRLAMEAFKSDKNDANRDTYAMTREVHKDAIANIKVVRPIWKNLIKELQNITG